jgi:hypothetical protein
MMMLLFAFRNKKSPVQYTFSGYLPCCLVPLCIRQVAVLNSTLSLSWTINAVVPKDVTLIIISVALGSVGQSIALESRVELLLCVCLHAVNEVDVLDQSSDCCCNDMYRGWGIHE